MTSQNIICGRIAESTTSSTGRRKFFSEDGMLKGRSILVTIEAYGYYPVTDDPVTLGLTSKTVKRYDLEPVPVCEAKDGNKFS